MPAVNKVKRKITTTACLGQCVNEYGEFEDFVDVIPRDVSCNTASTILRRKYNNQSITINKVDKEAHTYEMPIDMFIATATQVD